MYRSPDDARKFSGSARCTVRQQVARVRENRAGSFPMWNVCGAQ